MRFNIIIRSILNFKNTSEISAASGVVLDSISNYMNKASLYEDHWHDFVSNTVKLDKLRKQNITDIVPQYKEYINDKNL